jgi:hypothetical protein
MCMRELQTEAAMDCVIEPFRKAFSEWNTISEKRGTRTNCTHIAIYNSWQNILLACTPSGRERENEANGKKGVQTFSLSEHLSD